MPKPVDPLVIGYFATGLYTHRSQLFSPHRSVGVNIVTYHDAAIDGQDMEITTLLEWTRRPGFSRYCSQAFQFNEFPLQFYSSRQPSGNVVSFVDTNLNFSTFTTSAITHLVSKNTQKQGFIQQVGRMTYYGNGVDFQKWDGINFPSNFGLIAPTTAPTVAQTTGNVVFWEPNYSFPNYGLDFPVFVDTNGNFQTRGILFSTGAAAPIWNTAPGGLTPEPGSPNAWVNAGPFQGWTASTPYSRFSNAVLSVGQFIVDSNGNLQQATTPGTSGTTTPTWATHDAATTTDGTVIWTCHGSTNAGGGLITTSGVVTIQSGYVWAYAFRSIWGHLSTASPVTYTTGLGIGPFSVGTSGKGTADNQCAQSLSISNVNISSNVLTLTWNGTPPRNLVAGQNYTLSTFVTSTFLNGQVVNVSSVSAGTQSFTANFTHANVSTVDTGSADFNGIELYRTADGGGLLYYLTSCPNPAGGSGGNWNITDTFPDANLLTSFIAPLNHLNDPPPGALGSLKLLEGDGIGGTFMGYWQGRIWMVVGNRLYFNAGPDCINGVPEESWPPANVFPYSGPIQAVSRTSQGLLVWGSDYVSMVLGGPQTLSFFPYDLMQNFGISNSNAIDQDGDVITVMTTQNQVFTLDVSGKSETGNYILEVLVSSFTPTGSYVTYHRNGLDAGLWLSDGSTSAVRYNLNLGAWSTKYKPVGGIGALNSVETSPGITSLVMGRPTGGGYILARDLNNWQDDGQNYTSCFVTIGNIVLSQLGGQLAPVEHVALYCDAAGTGPSGPTLPTVSILPNEVSAALPASFLTLTNPVSEYTTANVDSRSLLSQRWPVTSINSALSSQLMHHLQVKVAFGPENTPNSLKALAILFKRDA